jgi:hypothetical protein
MPLTYFHKQVKKSFKAGKAFHFPGQLHPGDFPVIVITEELRRKVLWKRGFVTSSGPLPATNWIFHPGQEIT